MPPTPSGATSGVAGGSGGLALPLIDVSPMFNPGATPEQVQAVGRRMCEAAIHSGFLYVTGHGVDPTLMARVRDPRPPGPTFPPALPLLSASAPCTKPSPPPPHPRTHPPTLTHTHAPPLSFTPCRCMTVSEPWMGVHARVPVGAGSHTNLLLRHAPRCKGEREPYLHRASTLPPVPFSLFCCWVKVGNNNSACLCRRASPFG